MALSLTLSEVSVFRETDLDGKPRRVIEALSLEVEPGERVALVGANGAGKSSLLLALVGALRIEGEIHVDGMKLESRTLEEIRQRVGFVFSEPADQLFSRNVREEVELGPRLRGSDSADARARADAALAMVGLTGFDERNPTSLSLGEQRRLALATVLSIEAGALLLDEPTASLDGRARREVLNAIRATGATTLFATHDLDAALDLEARVVLLAGGKLVADGPARELLVDVETLDRAGLDLPLSRQHG
jgi:cobalt/nickel transport system ATP-binding protein